MVNMNVRYQRPALSLTTLRAEIDSIWPGRGPDLGFVTGYQSADNFTGHNPNERGICMAYDIGIHAGGKIGPAAGRDLADYLRQHANEKFQYLIHDMGSNSVRPMIAGNHTNWRWEAYGGPHPHSDHIHISIVDLYWGDHCGVPASVYDSTSSWGVVQNFAPGAAPAKPTPKVTTASVKPKPASTGAVRKTYGLQEIHWIVEPGDTLTRIANYYGIPHKLAAIAAYNGIRADKIRPGERIWIPGPLAWVIEGPDTIRSIAAYYGLDPGYLAKFNGLAGPDATIYVGNTLVIMR